MNRLLQFLFICLLGITFHACVDQEFDEPPIDGEDPGITPNATIADLKALYKPGQLVPITQDLTIGGVVVADDRSGNYYKSIILQDETAGIEVRISQTSAYNFYPIGRQLFIKCKGLVIGDYNGVAQLGGYTYIEGGASQLGDIIALNDYIIKGKRVGAPAPKVKKINELTAADVSTLIKLENVEFAGTDINLPFADIIGRASLNRTIKDCNGGSILLRTSGFATFANEKVPQGNGSIVGIYSIFGRDKQLFIRELTDVNMEGTRCTGGGGGGGSTGNETRISIQEVRNLFKGGTKTGPEGKKIAGVVISDRTTGNWDTRNLVIQDSTGGIAIRFANNNTFFVGDAVEIVIAGQELSEFNGLLQLNGVDNNLSKKTGTGPLPTPREGTVAEVKANLENWESTLVKIKSATLSGGSTYSGTRKINDATGNVDLFTRTQATFATEPLPSGTVEVVAVVSQFTNAQLIIRNTGDVKTGNVVDPGSSELISIRTLRSAFSGTTTTAPAGKKIRGVVISDKDNINWDGRNLVIQDTSGGIVVRFTANHTFTLGQEVEVNVGGKELSEFNGLLQVNSVANNLATLIGNGTLPTPREATIAQVLANLDAWESTLVKIKNATIASGTYSGSKDVTDGTGTIVLFTRTQATFSSQNVPSGMVEITAVVSQFTTPQLIIRNITDVK